MKRLVRLLLVFTVAFGFWDVALAKSLGHFVVDEPISFPGNQGEPVTLQKGKYEVQSTYGDIIAVTPTSDGQRSLIKGDEVSIDPETARRGVQLVETTRFGYQLLVPINTVEAILAEGVRIHGEADEAETGSESALISALDAPDGSPRGILRVDNNGKVITGFASTPSRYNFDAVNFEVRGYGNPTSSSGIRYAARFSNSGGSGSGVIIQAGYRHSRPRPIEVLRLAPFDGPAEFVFFNDGRAYGLSDGRLKKNVEELDDTLDKLTRIRGVTFEWQGTEDRQVGLIAQELESVFPELVTEVDGLKGIDYARLPAILIEAIKEMKAEVDDLRRQNEALAASLASQSR